MKDIARVVILNINPANLATFSPQGLKPRFINGRIVAALKGRSSTVTSSTEKLPKNARRDGVDTS
jgi:hypothetical protein